MKRIVRLATVNLAIGFLVISCSLRPQVPRAELEQIIRRDGVPFQVGSIPDEVLDRLASHRVVLIGEFHFLREHRELVAELLRELHARGFRQFLFEWTQVADWLLADFVLDGGLEPDWAPPLDIGGSMLTAIRDLNRTLPENERIQVHGIDVTLQDYGGAESFLWSLGRLAQHLPDPGPLSSVLQGAYDTPERRGTLLETLQAELDTRRSDLVAAWGQPWYETVAEMVEVERRAVAVRAMRESDYDESVRLREEAIQWLADRRIQSTPHGTLINVGSTHAQKERLWGTKIEWLGDYLVHRSQPAAGSVITLGALGAARTVSEPGSGIPDSDLSTSPKNELLRVMNEAWPDQIVFLPVDDPLFSNGRVPINVAGEIHVGAPKLHYDVYVLLPVAHRERFDD